MRAKRRKFYEIQREILQVLSDGKERSYDKLERELNANWLTVRENCEVLRIYGAVTIKESRIKITSSGKRSLAQLKQL